MTPESNVRYPAMRAELIDAIKALASPGYQQRVWVQQEMPKDVHYDDFDRVVHFLYDDCELTRDPCSLIGAILIDEREVELAVGVIRALDLIFEKHGMKLSDAEYVALSEWRDVVVHASGFVRNLE